MKKELIAIAKTFTIVVAGFLIASAIEKKFMSTKISVPATAQE